MNILIVKTSAIGDVIQTFPVLDYLKHKYPEAKIDWVVEKGIADLVSAQPHVRQVFAIDTKKWRKKLFDRNTWKEIQRVRKSLRSNQYDLLFDLQGNSKSALFTYWAKAKEKIGYGFKTLPEKLGGLVTNRRFNPPYGINIRLQYLYLVQACFNDFRDCPERLKKEKKLTGQIMVCFGSNWRNKQLSQETLGKFLEQIQLKWGVSFLFVFGNENEKKVGEELHKQFPEKSTLVGNLRLVQLQNLMEEVEIVISMDSAPLHLCGTTRTPSFSVFGPSSANIYKPLGTQHVAFQGSCPYGKTFAKRCPILRTCETGACMRDLSADTLFNAFEKFYQKDKDVEVFESHQGRSVPL